MNLTTIAVAIILAQYGGPPMWDRNPYHYRHVPRGPQMEPCIFEGQCRTPPIHDYPPPELIPPPMPRPWPGYPPPGPSRGPGYDDDWEDG